MLGVSDQLCHEEEKVDEEEAYEALLANYRKRLQHAASSFQPTAISTTVA
jgi:hypothetical protein